MLFLCQYIKLHFIYNLSVIKYKKIQLFLIKYYKLQVFSIIKLILNNYKQSLV
jgi:hypothetical protein